MPNPVRSRHARRFLRPAIAVLGIIALAQPLIAMRVGTSDVVRGLGLAPAVAHAAADPSMTRIDYAAGVAARDRGDYAAAAASFAAAVADGGPLAPMARMR